MSLDDSFRETVILDPDQTYERYGIRKRVELYDLVGFGEPMMEWSRKASELGATIVPRQVYLAKFYEQYDHRVAWVYHSQVHDDYVEDYHHIACDCVAGMDDPDSQIESIAECPGVLAALEHRAARVHEVMRHRGIFDFYGLPHGRTSPQGSAINPIKSMVSFLMNYEKHHPEGWVANTVSGEHQVSLLAAVMQIQPVPDAEGPSSVSMREIIEEMHDEGIVELHSDGNTVTLPQAA